MLYRRFLGLSKVYSREGQPPPNLLPRPKSVLHDLELEETSEALSLPKPNLIQQFKLAGEQLRICRILTAIDAQNVLSALLPDIYKLFYRDHTALHITHARNPVALPVYVF